MKTCGKLWINSMGESLQILHNFDYFRVIENFIHHGKKTGSV
jgi:hypothetical protein